MTASRIAAHTVAVLLVIAPPSPGEDSGLTVSVRSRSVRQGELLVLTIAGGGDLTGVRVDAFGRSAAAFRLDDGTWRALVGIDLAQPPGRYSAVVHGTRGSTDRQHAEPLVVVRRSFPVRTLRVDPGFVEPPQTQLARIAAEVEFIRHSYAGSVPEKLWTAPFVAPVPQPANSRFGARSVYNGKPRSPHAGTDFPSPAGTPVAAPNAGRVVASRELYFTGNTVIIDHGLGVVSLLAHLSRLDVREGEKVSAGQTVGLVGATGRVTGPHLHWAVSVSGARIDALSLLALLGRTAD